MMLKKPRAAGAGRGAGRSSPMAFLNAARSWRSVGRAGISQPRGPTGRIAAKGEDDIAGSIAMLDTQTDWNGADNASAAGCICHERPGSSPTRPFLNLPVARLSRPPCDGLPRMYRRPDLDRFITWSKTSGDWVGAFVEAVDIAWTGSDWKVIGVIRDLLC